MEDKLNLEIIKETIEDLKNNSNACTIIGGTTDSNGMFAIAESKPGKNLSSFIEYLYKNNLLDMNYLENNKKLENKDIQDMTLQEVLTRITCIIRGDRFNSGMIYSNFKDGTLLKLIERINELLK